MKRTTIEQTENVEIIPIIHLWGTLLIPIQGDIEDSQAEWLSEQVLHRIRVTQVEGLVIDVSGVGIVDSHLCGLLARLAAAAGLMGVRSLVSGMKPDIVMTLQAMGIDFGDLETAPSLQEALARLGLSPEPRDEPEATLAPYGPEIRDEPLPRSH